MRYARKPNVLGNTLRGVKYNTIIIYYNSIGDILSNIGETERKSYHTYYYYFVGGDHPAGLRVRRRYILLNMSYARLQNDNIILLLSLCETPICATV